jgi:hypothetical protein
MGRAEIQLLGSLHVFSVNIGSTLKTSRQNSYIKANVHVLNFITKYYSMKTCGGVEILLHHSYSRLLTEVSGQFQASAALSSGIQPSVPFVWEGKWELSSPV